MQSATNTLYAYTVIVLQKKFTQIRLAYKQFNHLKRSVFIINNLVSTHSLSVQCPQW